VASQAASIVYEATATLDPGSISGVHIATGDSYLLSFTYDDATTDTDGNTASGFFNSALAGITITPEPGNSGTWNGTTTTPLSLPGLSQSSPTTISFGASPTSFTVINGIPIEDVRVSFTDSGLVTDTGAGQTINDQLGGTLDGNPGNFESANLLLEGDGRTIVLKLSAVPEPNSIILLSAGLLLGLAKRKRS